MKMSIAVPNENTFLASLRTGVNLFAGAGFSVLASDKNGRSLPIGPSLKEELTDFFDQTQLNAIELPQAYAVLNSKFSNQLRKFLNERFTVDEFDARYASILKIEWKNIFTTNIDDLLPKIFVDHPLHYLNDEHLYGPTFLDKKAISFIALHGNVLHDNRPFIFSPTELASAFASDPNRWHSLVTAISRFPTLFWGYGLNDAGTLQAISVDVTKRGNESPKWIVVHPKSSAGTQEYFEALGFNVIVATTEGFLDYLTESLETPDGLRLNTCLDIHKAFMEYAVPRPADRYPMQPLLDFFQGAPPSWSHIFSGKISRTSRFDRVQNEILGKKNVMMVGMPASGKSTLLMQLASYCAFEGHKLIMSQVTPEKARYVLQLLGGQKALVFIDNVGDSIQAFNIFLKSSNVQIVGADRDYNLQIVAHLIPTDSVKIVDVTDLSDQDIGNCLANIPAELLRSNEPPRAGPKKFGERPQSLYELIESRLRSPTISARFRKYMDDFEESDPEMLDLLMMFGYVSKCCTPVSMDMLIAYLRGRIDDFKDVYIRREQLGRILHDYTGELADENQDFYIARSMLIADAICGIATTHFRTRFTAMFERFHEFVTPSRICRFDLFRRRAYDADFVQFAFEEDRAADFYDRMYRRDDSPYLLQQCAIYFSRKRNHSEAFRKIDEALLKCGGSIFSIRNSHAIILFSANKDLAANSSEARNELDRSMAILEECQASDKRSMFHVTVYVEQAMEYRQRVQNDTTKRYLEKAWLLIDTQLNATPWHSRVKSLHEKMQRIR
jgi:hypothetical protein